MNASIQPGVPTLFLFPNLLGECEDHREYLPYSVDEAVAQIDGLIAESSKGAIQFLRRFKTKKNPHLMPLTLYNKNTPPDHLDFVLEPLLRGESWGMISDAGLPCIADPGTKLVMRARQKGVRIHAYAGPSSIFLAQMLSGLPAQRFSFHGYLPKEPKERIAMIKALEKRSKEERATQLFIEAPYRNQHTLESSIDHLQEATWLCVAKEITLPTELVITKKIAQWRREELPDLAKKATIFLLYHGAI